MPEVEIGEKVLDASGVAALIDKSRLMPGVKWYADIHLDSKTKKDVLDAANKAAAEVLARHTGIPVEHIPPCTKALEDIRYLLTVEYPAAVPGSDIVRWGFSSATAKIFTGDVDIFEVRNGNGLYVANFLARRVSAVLGSSYEPSAVRIAGKERLDQFKAIFDGLESLI